RGKRRHSPVSSAPVGRVPHKIGVETDIHQASYDPNHLRPQHLTIKLASRRAPFSAPLQLEEWHGFATVTSRAPGRSRGVLKGGKRSPRLSRSCLKRPLARGGVG